jgi:GNAT superfamily N-acetyltransferase
MIKISIARAPTDYQAARAIIRRYESWLGMDLSFQGFDAEMNSLPSVYGPPRGAMIIAYQNKRPIGCVGLRDLGGSCCELKRMFVFPEYRTRGVGSMLFERFMRVADELGYHAVRLDTLKRLVKALRLYRKAGFAEIPGYRYNPDPEAVFMQLEISTWRLRQGTFYPVGSK